MTTRRVFITESSRRRTTGDDHDRRELDALEQRLENARLAAGDDDRSEIPSGSGTEEPTSTGALTAAQMLDKFGLTDEPDNGRLLGRAAYMERVKIESRLHPGADDRRAKIDAELERRRAAALPGSYQKSRGLQGAEIASRMRGGKL